MLYAEGPNCRVPNIVMLELFGIAAVGTVFTGYERGLEGRRARYRSSFDRAPVQVLLLILDLDRPTTGLLK